MIRKLILALALLSCLAIAQTVTPNMGLTLSNPGAQNWGLTTNNNFALIDSYFGGGSVLPGITVNKLTFPLIAGTNQCLYADPFGVVHGTGSACGAGGGGGNPPGGNVGDIQTNGGGGVFNGLTLLPIANGGTGTATPGLVAGTNITITGPWPNQTINSTGGGGTISGATCNVHGQAGADLGAKINACAAQIGFTIGFNSGFPATWIGTPGTIRVDSEDVGPIATQVIIPSDQTLSLGNGTYTNSFGQYIPPIVVSDRSQVQCDSWATTIQNTSQLVGENPVIGMANTMVCSTPAPPPCGATGCQVNCAWPKTDAVIIQGCHFKDSGSGSGTSLTGTVALTQCHGCKVLNNFFDGILTTAVSLVGSYTTNVAHPEWSHLYGQDEEIAGNLIVGPANAGISVINAKNFSIHHNTFRKHAAGASAYIDLESNNSFNLMEYGDVSNNIWDCSDPQAISQCFGITQQSVGPNVGHIKIHDNIFYGPPIGTLASQQVATAIGSGNNFLHGTRDIEIYNNQISDTTQPAITLLGTDNSSVHDNQITCAQGAATIYIAGQTLNSIIENNHISSPQLTVFTVTSVANGSGGQTVYTGTFTGGASNGVAFSTYQVAGFTNPLNNGTFGALASSATTLTLNNPAGVSETHAATASYGCVNSSGAGREAAFTTIAENNSTNDYNIYRNNTGISQIITKGTHSRVVNSQAANAGTDGAGQTFQIPTGFSTAIPGGIVAGTLTAPVLYQFGPLAVQPSCAPLVGTVQFYIVTAVAANGGEVPSNEVSNSVPINGCPRPGWSYVPGAASYNIYRATSSGAELLIDNVPQGTLGYSDAGGQTPGVAVPVTNTTGMLAAPLRTPVSSSAPCVTGAIVWDAGFIYVCTATNTWKQAALSSF